MNEIGDVVLGMEKEWCLGWCKEYCVSYLVVNNIWVVVNEFFIIGSIKMMYLYDFKVLVKEIVNCSCFMVLVMKYWEVDLNLIVKI